MCVSICLLHGFWNTRPPERAQLSSKKAPKTATRSMNKLLREIENCSCRFYPKSCETYSQTTPQQMSQGLVRGVPKTAGPATMSIWVEDGGLGLDNTPWISNYSLMYTKKNLFEPPRSLKISLSATALQLPPDRWIP